MVTDIDLYKAVLKSILVIVTALIFINFVFYLFEYFVLNKLHIVINRYIYIYTYTIHI